MGNLTTRNYSYQKIDGKYEIGYWEAGKWVCVQVVDTYAEILDFINENDIG